MKRNKKHKKSKYVRPDKSGTVFPKPYKNYIRTLCERMRWEMFCNEYKMDIIHEDSPEKWAAHIRIDLKYLNFTVTFNKQVLEMWKRKAHRDIQEVIVHEFCHLLTEPLYMAVIPFVSNSNQCFLEEVRERQTQRIANALSAFKPEQVFKIKKG